jgi:predicted transcriptional regulator
VGYDEWFRSEVRAGLRQIEQGRTVSHADAGNRLGGYLAGKKQHA